VLFRTRYTILCSLPCCSEKAMLVWTTGCAVQNTLHYLM